MLDLRLKDMENNQDLRMQELLVIRREHSDVVNKMTIELSDMRNELKEKQQRCITLEVGNDDDKFTIKCIYVLLYYLIYCEGAK